VRNAYLQKSSNMSIRPTPKKIEEEKEGFSFIHSVKDYISSMFKAGQKNDNEVKQRTTFNKGMNSNMSPRGESLPMIRTENYIKGRMNGNKSHQDTPRPMKGSSQVKNNLNKNDVSQISEELIKILTEEVLKRVPVTYQLPMDVEISPDSKRGKKRSNRNRDVEEDYDYSRPLKKRKISSKKSEKKN